MLRPRARSQAISVVQDAQHSHRPPFTAEGLADALGMGELLRGSMGFNGMVNIWAHAKDGKKALDEHVRL